MYVTLFAIIPFTVNPAAKPLKFAAGVASRFVSSIVPVPVAIFPLRFTASVVKSNVFNNHENIRGSDYYK
uniref:hypothetical protein n=1 Tax=Aliarcobacter sp. TaxID=2321116 RepID=UPI0040470FE3